MSITLFIERPGEQSISVDEWIQLVEKQADLRLMTEATSTSNARTGASIQIKAEQGATEINVQGSWLPFLSWRRGRLCTRYREEFENSANHTRMKIVQVARELRAQVCNDVEDEPLDWLESDA